MVWYINLSIISVYNIIWYVVRAPKNQKVNTKPLNHFQPPNKILMAVIAQQQCATSTPRKGVPGSTGVERKFRELRTKP